MPGDPVTQLAVSKHWRNVILHTWLIILLSHIFMVALC